jgi:prevent-host-death family protein
MLRTATVSELRAELAKYLKELDEGSVMVLSHGTPVGVLVEPDRYYALLDKCEMLEDLLKALRPIARTIEERSDTGDIKAV